MTESEVNTLHAPVLYLHFCGSINDCVVANSDASSYYLNSACQHCDSHGTTFIIYKDDACDVGCCINIACIRDDGNGSVTQITVCREDFVSFMIS